MSGGLLGLAWASLAINYTITDWYSFVDLYGMPSMMAGRRRWREVWNRRIDKDGKHRRHRRAMRRMNKIERSM